jgi:hypothetical protein
VLAKRSFGKLLPAGANMAAVLHVAVSQSCRLLESGCAHSLYRLYSLTRTGQHMCLWCSCNFCELIVPAVHAVVTVTVTITAYLLGPGGALFCNTAVVAPLGKPILAAQFEALLPELRPSFWLQDHLQ